MARRGPKLLMNCNPAMIHDYNRFYNRKTALHLIIPHFRLLSRSRQKVRFGISVNTRHQVLIKRGLTYSVPVYVDVAPAQPSIFLLDGVTPAITATRGDQAAFLISKSAPARVGDVLTIYCAGLGLTDMTIGDGAAAPLDGLIRTESPVSVSIGGQLAAASFAGLSPGFVGVYQVNVTVPPDVIPGDSVPLNISVSGQSSPTAPLPIR